MSFTRIKGIGIWVAMLMCVVFLVAVVPGSGKAAQREKIKLRLAAGHPYAPGCFWIVGLEDFFCREAEKRVRERTKYNLEIKSFYGGSVAKLGEALETVQNGLADLGLVLPVFEMAKLEPFNFTFWTPFTTSDMDKALRAALKTIDHFPMFEEILKKYNQKRCGAGHTPQSSYQLITKFPVRTMDDLKGKKLGHGGPMLPWLAALGATSVQATYNEVYTSMDTGVIDGYSMPANVVTGFKIYEVGKYFTNVDFVATVTAFITINLRSWNKLPKDVQDILAEVGNEYSWDIYKRCLADQNAAIDVMKNAGVAIYNLPEKERARWAKTLDDARVAAKAIASCKGHGYPADEIARFYIKTLKEDEGVKFPYPPTLDMK